MRVQVYWGNRVRDGLVSRIGSIDLFNDILLSLFLSRLCRSPKDPWRHHFEEEDEDKEVALGFPVRASFDCWDLRSLRGVARPNQSSVSVGSSGWRFEQNCKFHTQSVTPFSLGKSPVVIGLLLSTVHRCQDFPSLDKRRPADAEVLGRTCVDSMGRQG